MVLDRLSLSSADTAKQSDVYKEPIWDIILSYTSVMSAFLSVLTIGGELFFPDLTCYPPNNVSRTQAPFIDSWCSNAHLGRVSSMPLILLGQSIALYMPSLFFHHRFFSKIRQFFIEAKALDRHRNRDQFRSSKAMKNWYVIKLIVQGLIAGGFIVLLALLYESDSVVHATFTCAVEIDTEPMWSVNVSCVYPAASTLYALWIANFVNLSAAMFFAFRGTFWNVYSKTVDYAKTAQYQYSYGTRRVNKKDAEYSRLPDDLHLLHKLLFDFDFGMGRSFEELLIDLELVDLKHLSYCQILDRSFQTIPTDQTSKILISDIPSVIAHQCFDQYKKATGRSTISECLHLWCGEGSCTIEMAQHCLSVRGVNFNFRKQFAFDGVAEVGKEREVVVKEKFPERVEIFRVPRLSSLGSEEIGKFMSELISCPKEDPYNYDLVLITQLDQSQDILKEKKRELKIILERMKDHVSKECVIVLCTHIPDNLENDILSIFPTGSSTEKEKIEQSDVFCWARKLNGN
ncbi:uncharacterized protein [Oscarella lobularis]|uniref:uncharacterized protein isoform X2 n=1 Tax=Oscarella lobularis TaxID=121494 RepID=UPI00331325F9